MFSRQKFLQYAFSAFAAGGLSALLIPFARYLGFAKHKEREYLDIKIGNLEVGEVKAINRDNKPIRIIRRSRLVLDILNSPNPNLLDPDSTESKQPDAARNPYRSLRPDIFVVYKYCTHLGCGITHRPDMAPEDLGPDWKGGFFCPCHGALYDSAGRVYKNTPAPKNLDIPNYEFIDENTIRIHRHKRAFQPLQ